MAPRFSLLSTSSRTPGLAAPWALAGASGECPVRKEAAVPPPPPPSLSELLAYEVRFRMGLAVAVAEGVVPLLLPAAAEDANAISSFSATYCPFEVSAYT